MNLILLGAPGAGKGTQAELLVKALSIPAISTGNMLRDAMNHNTPLGEQVRQIMDSGMLVPDDVVLDLVSRRVARDDCKNGFILDGVPRTLSQAEALDAAGITVDYVVSIEIEDSVIEGRMTGRRVCPKALPLAMASRSIFPVEMAGMESFSLSSSACVPLPAPGAPSRIRFILPCLLN